MSTRGQELLSTADQQIRQLIALLTTADEAGLHRPCPGREKLGDGSVVAVALHIANTYLRIAQFAHGDGAADQITGAHHEGREIEPHIDPPRLVQRLTAGQHALKALADLTENQLDAVPPAGQARFCDGKRSTEQVLAAMLNHQAHQVDALTAAIA
jgi:hypothetical protein